MRFEKLVGRISASVPRRLGTSAALTLPCPFPAYVKHPLAQNIAAPCTCPSLRALDRPHLAAACALPRRTCCLRLCPASTARSAWPATPPAPLSAPMH